MENVPTGSARSDLMSWPADAGSAEAITVGRAGSDRPRTRTGRSRLLSMAVTIAVAAVTAATGGCSSAGSHPAAGSSSHPAAGSSSRPAAASPAATPALATGPELAQLLPPHVSSPPGWSVPGAKTAFWNRTATFGKPLAELGPAGRGMNACTNWTIALSPQNLLSDWEMSFAVARVEPPHVPGSTIPVGLQLADFRPGDAARQLAADAAFARRCHSYREPTDGSRVTVTASALSGLADQSLYVQLVNPYPLGGSTIHDHTNVLLVRVGNDIIGAGQAGNATNPLNPVVPLSDLRQIAGRIITALTAARSAG